MFLLDPNNRQLGLYRLTCSDKKLMNIHMNESVKFYVGNDNENFVLRHFVLAAVSPLLLLLPSNFQTHLKYVKVAPNVKYEIWLELRYSKRK